MPHNGFIYEASMDMMDNSKQDAVSDVRWYNCGASSATLLMENTALILGWGYQGIKIFSSARF